MKLTMWRVVVVQNLHTKFREKWSPSSFQDKNIIFIPHTEKKTFKKDKYCLCRVQAT